MVDYFNARVNMWLSPCSEVLLLERVPEEACSRFQLNRFVEDDKYSIRNLDFIVPRRTIELVFDLAEK